jgi:hypothetical protein
MDTVKRDLRQKGMRIESRAQSHTTEPPTPTAFAASHDDATIELRWRSASTSGKLSGAKVHIVPGEFN